MITPINYNIYLEPNLEHFNFEGRVKLDLKTTDPITKIELDALELEVHKCTVNNNPLTYNMDLDGQKLIIELSSPMSGEFSVDIEYSGSINNKLAGFYRSKFIVDGKEEYAAVTQFQENDARRAFPCFDTPGKKATFEIEFLIDKKYTAISNERIISEKEINGKKLVKFAKTPIMSTYLVFFAVGNFEFLNSEFRGKPARLVASPGKAIKHGKFGLDFGIKSLEYCEDYFDIEYPLSKMDFIGTPDFAHGAMENYGAILFRENLLLKYPGITTTRQENGIMMVIAHEVTHQWFGNLVSPKTWKYLWLNESFATYFGFGIVAHYKPERYIWEYFVQSETSQALVSDAYIETAPIELPGDTIQGLTIKNANILYNKGGSILRMLEDYMGEDEFRNGLRTFLKKHAFSIATSDDLWAAFEESSGKPVNKLMRSWVFQLGYPIITAKTDNNKIILSQKRFTYLDNDFNTTWIIPVSIRYYYNNSDEIRHYLMEDQSISVDIPENTVAYKINVDLKGFYHVKYEKENLAKLLTLMKNNKLSRLDSYSLLIDMYARLINRDITLDDYLEFITNYSDQKNHMTISSISNQLYSLFRFMDDKTKIMNIGRNYLENILELIGYEEQDGEDHTITSIRGGLILNAVRFESAKATTFAMDLFEKYKSGETIPADLISTILQIAAIQTSDFEWFRNKFETASNEQESIYYIVAMSSIMDNKVIQEMQSYIFEKIPGRNRSIAIGVLAQNPNARDTLWKWYIANLDNFEALHPFMYQRAITSIVPECVNDVDDINDFFEEYTKKKPMIKDAIDVALERMKINAQIKKHINK